VRRRSDGEDRPEEGVPGALHAPAKKVALVEVPELQFLMVDGAGDPNTSQEYQDAIQALYSLSYTLKFMIKKAGTGSDFVVMPLESLWWSGPEGELDVSDKNAWQWTAMVLQPDFVTDGLVEEARRQASEKKDVPALPKVRLESFHEGLAAQALHIGPYSEEGPTIERIHQFIRDSGYRPNGKHHEIYMSDPRRARPERLKTVIRQPVG
jgi:hypothetical protein